MSRETLQARIERAAAGTASMRAEREYEAAREAAAEARARELHWDRIDGVFTENYPGEETYTAPHIETWSDLCADQAINVPGFDER